MPEFNNIFYYDEMCDFIADLVYPFTIIELSETKIK